MTRLQLMGVVLLCFLINGCAGPQTHLEAEQMASVKKVAIMAMPLSRSPHILDHTEVWGKSYTNGMFGAAGTLLEGMVLSVETGVAKKGSLGGDAGQFLKGVRPLTIQEDLEVALHNKLAGSFEVLD